MLKLAKKPKQPKPTKLDLALNRIYRLHTKEIDLGLERVYRLLHDLGNPQDHLPPVLHIAGTNGKGSTLAYIQAILESSNHSVHKHTSPHLVRFNERLILRGKEIDDAKLLSLIEEIEKKNKKQPTTFFEFTMALHMLAFSRENADVTLLETGMGGRLDASNVVTSPLATLISPIGLDHMRFLGDTLPKIAKEKAGIMKPGTPCFVNKQISDQVYDVFWDKATAMDVPLYVYDKDWQVERRNNGFDLIFKDKTLSLPLPSLFGDHQIDNASFAIACLYLLNHFDIPDNAYAEGITNTKWPARMQHISEGYLPSLLKQGGQIWLDGGHNTQGMEAIAKTVKHWNEEDFETHLIYGSLANRDPNTIITPILPHVTSIQTVSFKYPKARTAQETSYALKNLDVSTTPHDSVENALKHLAPKLNNNSRVLICGSLYLAGTVLKKNAENTLA